MNPTGETMNWGIVGDTRERRIFKIPVGHLTDDEIKGIVEKMDKSINKL